MKLPAHIHTQTAATEALFALLKESNYYQIAVLTDENTAQHCLPLLKEVLPAGILHIRINSGEENKNLTSCAHIWEELTLAGFDRKGLLINLGGGVITDMGGFCAATYKRGIPFINIPTTLLSQVDASVGGKLGIDFMGFKNHIGLFQDARAVIIDPVFLETLPLRELRSGYAEVVKHALIADKGHWEQLQKTPWQQQNWQSIIDHSIGIKHGITTADPTEKGLRKVLNFGHTIGHAIESYFLEKGAEKLLHGEAIALGMICESYLSQQKTGLEEQEVKNICNYIATVYPLTPVPSQAYDFITGLALQDKKNEQGVINCTLLEKTGEAVYNKAVNRKEIQEALDWYNKKGWQ